MRTDTRKVFILDGNKFSNLEEFFRTFKNVMTMGNIKDVKMKETKFSFDAVAEILAGGHGKFAEEEPIILIWKNAAKSKVDLASHDGLRDHYEPLVKVLSRQKHVELQLM